MKPVSQLSEDEFAHLVQRAATLPDAPKALIRAAIDQWPAAKTSTLQAAAKEMLTRVTALLSFDSWASPPMALGVRAMPSDTRHLLFTAKGRDIDVRIAPVNGHFALTGQILGPDDSGFVELAAASENSGEAPGVQIASLDALGEFRLRGVHHGTYVLTFRLSGEEIVLPPIDVGGQRR